MAKLALIIGLAILVCVAVGFVWGAFVLFWVCAGVILVGFVIGVTVKKKW